MTAIAAVLLASACHVPDRHYAQPTADAPPDDDGMQPDGSMPASGPPIRALNGNVFATLHADHAWYVGGTFDRVSPYAAPYVTQLDDAGAVKSCLGGFNNDVDTFVRNGTALYAGGRFTMYDGTPVGYIAKIDVVTCELDTTFSGGGGFDGWVNALAVSGTSLFVGGSFSAYRGVASSANAIAKLDVQTGAVDATFSPPGASTNGFSLFIAGSPNPATVYALAVSSTSVYVGGRFNSYRGAQSSANAIAKLDVATGALDTVFSPPGATANGFNTANGESVYALAVAGTSLYVGGATFSYRGVSSSAVAIAKLDLQSGVLDTTFNQPGAAGFIQTGGSDVGALAVSGSSLYVGGYFSSYRLMGAHTANNLAKLDLVTGVLDTTFSPPGATANGFDFSVNALAVSGSSLYVGGGFSAYRGVAGSAQRIAKLDLATGTLDSSFVPSGSTINGFDQNVHALSYDGTLWVGGHFTLYAGCSGLGGIVKLDDTTLALDTTFSPPGMTNGFDAEVSALAASTSSLYVGGSFTAYRGVAHSASNLAKLDLATGALDTIFSPPGADANGFESPVDALAVDGTALYVGGSFTTYRGVTSSANHIAKLDLTTGALDASFSPTGATSNGFDNSVGALAISGGSLYAGGDFTEYKGVLSANRLAKLDKSSGAFDSTFSPPGPTANGFDGSVTSIVAAGSSLYIGGYFTAYRGAASSANCLAKLDLTTGALDTTFSPPGAAANGFDDISLALAASTTSLYVGGAFSAYRGVGVPGSPIAIAKLDLSSGALDTTFDPPATNGIDNSVWAIALSSQSLLLGGYFHSYRGRAAEHIVVVDTTTGAIQ